MVRQIIFLMISCLLLSLDLSSQCAMCKAVVEANLEAGGTKGAGLNDGILFLMSMPYICLLYTSPSPRDKRQSRMPSSA